ncbi:hypothetical protein EXIGLDRAFT_781114 [Exidia glandulosa HHB12029]|uniref:Uncharacterized protein n=1 Tax=Exidia glandulosa HHB12029 TaxID=1314781 RepID=A0A165Z8P0_EXIGL|nr:hypothetical protein EXIGLDRAFT_781114 [Exidia glandulosa HHB12029]
MHTRRTSTLPVLSLALPRPSLPRTSSGTPAPQTPRTAVAPAKTRKRSLSSPRTSSDSWGSYSEQGDEDGVEWLPENVCLLATTLDMLPGRITTPFHGPVPPGNFLDRLAREVVEAKGKDWPHSIRATRVKLLEIARALPHRDTIHEEHEEELARIAAEESKENVSIKRPLYRQSSMDFLPKKREIQLSANLGRLSSRLQRTDRIVNPGYHPYPRPASRSPTPPLSTEENASQAAPSTRSQTLRARALTTSGAGSARPPMRRVASVMLAHPKASSSQPVTPVEPRTPTTPSLANVPCTGVAVAPRIKRAGSFNAPANPTALKRAPSFSGSSSLRSVATVASALARVGEASAEAPSTSSDEEEKARQRKSKRARTGIATSVEKGVAKSPKTRSMTRAEKAVGTSTTATIAPKDGQTKPKLRPKQQQPQPQQHRRSPSYFGDELPFVPAQPVDPRKMPFPAEREATPALSSAAPSPPQSTAGDQEMSDTQGEAESTSTVRASKRQRPKLHIDTQNENNVNGGGPPHQRTLRRSRMTAFPTRRISFSTFVAPSNSQPSGEGLQSAIQLS